METLRNNTGVLIRFCFNYHENLKTCGEIVLDIKCVFRVSLQILSEIFFVSINM
jgi:hypothetical protein